MKANPKEIIDSHIVYISDEVIDSEGPIDFYDQRFY